MVGVSSSSELELEAHDKVNYLGFQNQNKLEQIYASCFILVLPSIEESFGVPLIEALSKNCRVCASNAGALPETGGQFVNYFKLGSQFSFQRALRASLNQGHDWEKLTHHLDKFNRKAVALKIKDIIQ